MIINMARIGGWNGPQLCARRLGADTYMGSVWTNGELVNRLRNDGSSLLISLAKQRELNDLLSLSLLQESTNLAI